MTDMARWWMALAAVLAGGALGGMLFGTAPAAMASTSAGRTPTAPANLHVVSNDQNGVDLAWNPSTDNGGTVDYFLYFDNNPNPFIAGSNTSYDVQINVAEGFTPGSTHTFKVQAQNVGTGNNSPFSSPLTVTFAQGDNSPPTAPTNLHVVSNDSRGIGLAWDPSTDDTSIAEYYLDGQPCSPVNEGTATQVIVPSVNSDPVCGIMPGDTYTFSVRARDSVGFDSPYSNTVTVTFNG